MSWEPEIEELRRRQAMAREMGGPEKVARQHNGGKLTVRERIATLLDSGSFSEIGSHRRQARVRRHRRPQSSHADQFRLRPRPHRRPSVAVGGDDFTVRGGASDASDPSKSRWLPSRWRTSCACRWCAWSKAVAAAAR